MGADSAGGAAGHTVGDTASNVAGDPAGNVAGDFERDTGHSTIYSDSNCR